MAKGWIKLHRQSVDNPLYHSEPFDKWHAWTDILLMVNHERKEFISKGQLITLEPGQTITSLPILAKRWQWSVNRVRRYLKLLSGMGMCTINGTARGTTITVVKWAFYQSEGHANGMGNGMADGTADEYADGTLTRMNKNDKETKNARARDVVFEEWMRRYHSDDISGDAGDPQDPQREI